MVTMTGGTVPRTVIQRVSTANTVAGLFEGKGDPTGADTAGAPAGAAYLNKTTGDIFQLGVDMEWTKIANVKGPKGEDGTPGDGTLSDDELAAIEAALESSLEPQIDLTIVFENALAGE